MDLPETPVIVCITDVPAERVRLAELFDGAGVLVMASDADSARTFLDRLRAESANSAEPRAARVVGAGDLRLDLDRHEATWRGRPLPLTRHELAVLACLVGSPGRVWTYRQLHDHAWDGSYFTGPAAVQSVIKRLRAKLRQAGVPLHIDAARGLGFRSQPPAQETGGDLDGHLPTGLLPGQAG